MLSRTWPDRPELVHFPGRRIAPGPNLVAEYGNRNGVGVVSVREAGLPREREVVSFLGPEEVGGAEVLREKKFQCSKNIQVARNIIMYVC